MEFKVEDNLRNKSGIYKITNLTNGKFYIGSATRLRKRFSDHKRYLERKTHDNDHLTNSYHLNGAENFVFECIELVAKEKLIEREQFYIDSLSACNENIGYNICPTAGSTLGLKRTQESKDEISKKHGRKVFQWSEDEYLFREYESIGMASKETGLNRGSIKCAALGYSKHKYANFIWSYESVPSKTKGHSREKRDSSIVNRISDTKSTKIIKKDIGGKFLSEHKSARCIQLETGILAEGVRLSCRKGTIYAGYRWEYAEKVKNGGRVGEKSTRFGVLFTTEQLIDISRKSGPVIQYDLNGNIVKEHLSLIEAHLYSGVDKDLIRYCCIYNKHNVGGFIFRRKNFLDRKYKKIHMLDDNSEIIESFDSIYQACEKHKMLTSSVYQAIRKNFKCNNYFWRFE